jgi:hypothetical protein
MTATWTTRLGVPVAAVLLVGLVGCSDDKKDSAAGPTPTASSPAGPDLEKLLMQDGEEPGFVRGAQPDAQPSALDTISGLDAYVKEFGLTAADKTRLQGEGFLTFVAAPIKSGAETAGVTNVALYETAAGAAHSLANDLQPAVINLGGQLQGLQFFDVPGVPGARGYTATEPHVANVLWADGRCYYVLGNAGPGDLKTQLIKGVTAMYARTKGQCA